MAGDVRGLRLLDVCCAGDAHQAFSWENLGASVTACDISSVAIDIAEENARKIGSQVQFHVADAQVLAPIPDAAFDLVVASFIVWFEDIFKAVKAWCRVLKLGGRLLLHFGNPVTKCLEAEDGKVEIVWDYLEPPQEYYDFTGTPLADRHGGWEESEPVVEFHHSIADVFNAVVDAGLRIERVRETGESSDDPLSKLPAFFTLRAKK